uniref:PI4-kinase N-terminal domain-containing protein n=1 Tax=Lactuca sativa TaxID=4236 RepID=A0A9R1VGD9_LACSA|nr:hypothetical protein LSAT_V11C500274580 [Lactuca sativa]
MLDEHFRFQDADSKTNVESFLQLLRLLCWCPAYVSTIEAMETGIFIWTWLVSDAPQHVMLLGLKFCTCQYEGSVQKVRLGIQLLEDGIYRYYIQLWKTETNCRATLGWFAYEPEWFEHDHGNFAHIEAQSVNSFVHYLQNDPKALGGEYEGSLLDIKDHCHPVWGPMENYAACRDKRKQLLLMLCQHEADRLEVWAPTVNYKYFHQLQFCNM